MFWFSFFVIFLTSLYFGLKSLFKKRDKPHFSLVITEKKDTLKSEEIDIFNSIPLLFYGTQNEDLILEEGESVDLSTPFLIKEGECELICRDTVIIKKEGECVFYTLGILTGNLIFECKTTKKSIITKIDLHSKYILFSIFKKKCIEVVNGYFRITKWFIEAEQEMNRGLFTENCNEEDQKGDTDEGRTNIHAHKDETHKDKLHKDESHKDKTHKDPIHAHKDSIHAHNPPTYARIIHNNTHKPPPTFTLHPFSNSILPTPSFRILEKNEFIKQFNEPFNDFFFIHYGEVILKLESGEEFIFKEGDCVGYFNLFFDVFEFVELKAFNKSKISIYEYNSLKKNGLNEEDFYWPLFEKSPNFFHFVDLSCEWVVLKPGTILVREGEVLEDFYFYNSEVVGCKECLLGNIYQEKVIVNKMSDVLKIKKGLIEKYLKMGPSSDEIARVLFKVDGSKVDGSKVSDSKVSNSKVDGMKASNSKVGNNKIMDNDKVDGTKVDGTKVGNYTKAIDSKLKTHKVSPHPTYSRSSNSTNIITIIPADKHSNVLLFTKRLKASIGKECLLLGVRDISEILCKRVFTICEELRILDFLKRMTRAYSVVIIFIENEYSRFLNYLLKYSKTCLIAGTLLKCPEMIFQYPRYCEMEYVRIYEDRKDRGVGKGGDLKEGCKVRDLKVGCKVGKGDPSLIATNKTPTLDKTPTLNKTPTQEFNRVHHVVSPSRTVLFDNKDFERLGRYLLGRRIGLVLSGGGARGLAHIGVIQALEEEGIPIDIIGGTSMGAFIGALYSRDCDNSHVFRDSKKFCTKARSIWPFILDLTYPICSFFSGKKINESLKKIFKLQLIQDLWIEYFCLTTNLFTNDEEVHRSGLIWKYVRASMGICGYLPPVCDKRGFLVDGGYINNVPADVMLKMGVSLVLAIDIGTVYENDYDDYGEYFNGFTAFFHKYFKTRKYLTMEEIQYRIAFLTTEKKVKELENNKRVLLMRPDLGDIKTGDFHRFDEIVAQGYQAGKKKIKEWKKTGEYDFENINLKKSRRRYSV